MMNSAVVMGRLTSDPDYRTTPNGVPVAQFTLACARDFKGTGGERESDFIDVVAWRSMAEYVRRNFHKGQPAAVEGRIRTGNYTDRSGARRKRFEIFAERVYSIEGRRQNGKSAPAEDASAYASEDIFFEGASDEDLPF